MDTFWKLASGGSTIEEFAKDVYIKSNLTTNIDRALKQLLSEVKQQTQVLIECSSPVVHQFVNCMEALFLHGLKEKLTLSKMLVNTHRVSKRHELDFWPVVLILSHNQVSDSLMKLKNITSDIGRCKAWIRLALNDNLLHSYIEALINDTSLLCGFYRPSAYLRDKEHMDLLKSSFYNLEALVFQLSYDHSSLNCWDADTLALIGVTMPESPSPVMPAVDALELINNSSKRGRKRVENKRKSDKKEVKVVEETVKINTESATTASNGIDVVQCKVVENRESNVNKVAENEGTKNERTSEETTNDQQTPSFTFSPPSDHASPHSEESPPSPPSSLMDSASIGGNSIGNKEGWSTLPPNCDDNKENETYDAILQSYSTLAVLSSTPDMKDFSGLNDAELKSQKKTPLFRRKRRGFTPKKQSDNYIGNIMDFEVVPKTIVLDNEEPEVQEFLMQLPLISNEVGLDEQDYKCASCGRPVGMIYGKSRVCNFDGLNYCLECHSDEKMVIPGRILHNWDFNKYPVANRNRDKLQSTESEAFIDVKVLSPILYKIKPAMEECLNLRTQLFYLHTYLFTCQESVALELRKLVWPREHLYDHIHLYSCADLIQVQSGVLASFLKKAIAFGRKHVLSCLLCSQKGFICEICKSSQIIYPFDTDSTYRCDKCKAVFHSTCVIDGSETKPCPRCLRIQRRERTSNQ